MHFRGRGSTRDMFIRVVRGPGADFLRRVAFWSIRSSGLLRWFCVTSAALRMTRHHFFVAGAVLETGSKVEQKKSQNALVRGRQLCTQLSIFEGSLAELSRFWCCQLRKLRVSRRIVSFLVLQNCFVFDVVKFKNWGSRAELLRFWRCQVQKLRTFRRETKFLVVALHYPTLHYTTLIILHYATTTTILPYTRLHYTIPHYTTLHDITVHYTTLITLHYTNYIQLHCTTAIALTTITTTTTTITTTLRYTNYTAAHYNYKYNHNYNHTTLHNTTLHWLYTLHYATTTPTTAAATERPQKPFWIVLIRALSYEHLA